jgi:hypothetical protein
MIPDQDYYADKDGKLTNDPEKFAVQVATKGVSLDERIAKRFGLNDLVSTDEPGAPRRIKIGSDAKPEAKESPEETSTETSEAEPEAEEPKAAAAKPAVKKEADKGAKKK